jgi:hypothetical protein
MVSPNNKGCVLNIQLAFLSCATQMGGRSGQRQQNVHMQPLKPTAAVFMCEVLHGSVLFLICLSRTAEQCALIAGSILASAG